MCENSIDENKMTGGRWSRNAFMLLQQLECVGHQEAQRQSTKLPTLSFHMLVMSVLFFIWVLGIYTCINSLKSLHSTVTWRYKACLLQGL